jgi:hypothetical protein
MRRSSLEERPDAFLYVVGLEQPGVRGIAGRQVTD